MAWIWKRRSGDSGVTLVELSVTILLLGVVSAFVSGAVIGAQKLFRVGDDQTRGLEQVRVAAERLSRDVRDARAVMCNPAGTPAALATADPTCAFHLQLWIDYNSDYVQQASETVTWQLVASGAAGHYNFVRSVNGSNQVEASAIVRQVAFAYCSGVTPSGANPTSCVAITPSSTIPAPGATQAKIVNVDMSYDALYQNGKTSNRTITFSDRLRNVS
jgi:prepilin-type N-terminal cleavage/methylation domain-containing protein